MIDKLLIEKFAYKYIIKKDFSLPRNPTIVKIFRTIGNMIEKKEYDLKNRLRKLTEYKY